MKQRLISAFVGLFIFFGILALYSTPVIDVSVYAITQMMVFELLRANKVDHNKPIAILSYITSTIVYLPLSNPALLFLGNYWILAVFLLFLGYVAILLRFHSEFPFEKITVTAINSVLVAISMGTLVGMNYNLGYQIGLYLTMLIFCCAWGSDSGAYFAGRFLGKKKLAPVISPKKTVEGVYGGVAGCIFFVILMTVIFSTICNNYGWGFLIGETSFFTIKLAFMSICGSLIGVVGDLLASTVKRQCDIKDYGTIMPGHGGVLDRFDSVLLVAPTIYVLYLVLI